MKDTTVDTLSDTTLSVGSNLIEKLTYKDNSVYINKLQRFSNIPQSVWDFQIGGYQPLEKWLKDRKGTVLSDGDVCHYRLIVGSIIKTQALMSDVDSAIEQL